MKSDNSIKNKWGLFSIIFIVEDKVEKKFFFLRQPEIWFSLQLSPQSRINWSKNMFTTFGGLMHLKISMRLLMCNAGVKLPLENKYLAFLQKLFEVTKTV